MSDYLVQELTAVRAQVARLESRRVTRRTVEVTAADSGTSTFTAVTEEGEEVTPVESPPQFLPEAGQTVTLQLEGATPSYNPAGIAIGAVGNREVSSISADYISAGLLTGEVALANRITTALEGARVELNPLGLQKWNASEELMISFTGDDNLLTGTFKTAPSGRRVEIGASGNVGRVSMIAADGTVGVLEGWTEPETSLESLRMSMPITGAWPAWNGFQLQSDEVSYWSARQMTITFGGGSGGQKFGIYYASNKGSGSATPTRSERYSTTETEHRFLIGDFAAEGDLRIVPHNVVDSRIRSPRLQLRGSTTNLQNLKYVCESGGTSPRIEVTNAADSGYGPIWASAFTVSSAESGKEQIADLPEGAVDRLLAARVRVWRVREDNGELSSLRAGLIAEEAPTDVVEGQREAINLYTLVGVTVAGLQRAARLIVDLRQRIKALEDKVALL